MDEPILLFEVINDDDCRGVYYIPQRGVGIEGFVNDWSIKTVARHISVSNFNDFEPGEINPEDLTESSIIKAVRDWMGVEKDPSGSAVFIGDNPEDEFSITEVDYNHLSELM